MSQFDLHLVYIPGEENTAANTLSRLPCTKEHQPDESALCPRPAYESWLAHNIGSVLCITAD
ncbi:hypothetical protein FISHEDRAFT_43892 [Fistulina hepatica ATCC 64428]|uniref:Uncharacterized protein n=1 Tax=Fistulina hepatica ATCC 64428 TaxID=1128425 RepID=A0A0D7ABQ7_9AGAR|nr:hypothetical protein FISHEDRAFT_43892 [Fistulina hepatica ATCC 64428]